MPTDRSLSVRRLPLYDVLTLADPLKAIPPIPDATASQIIVFTRRPLPPALSGAIQSQVNHLPGTGCSFGVLPVGTAGTILWNRLPWEISRLAAHPLRDAVLFCDRSVANAIPQGWNLWQYLLTVPAPAIHVADGVPGNLDGFERPELTFPKSPSLPDFLDLALEALRPKANVSTEATALHAGAALLLDQEQRSHRFSQSIEGAGRHHNGDFWHAILHRREPDFGNSKYWFRHVGRHPIFKELATYADEILKGTETAAWRQRLISGVWNPAAFIDLCQEVQHDANHPLHRAAQEIQWLEMLLLLQQSWVDAG